MKRPAQPLLRTPLTATLAATAVVCAGFNCYYEFFGASGTAAAHIFAFASPIATIIVSLVFLRTINGNP